MRQLWLLTFLVGFCLLLAACSADTAVASNRSVSFTVEGNDDLSFTPSSLIAPADTGINLTFVNAGTNPHSFAIITEGVDLFTADEGTVFQSISTGEVEGGDSFRVPISGLEPGSYTYVCLIAGHAAAGMIGTLTVAER